MGTYLDSVCPLLMYVLWGADMFQGCWMLPVQSCAERRVVTLDDKNEVQGLRAHPARGKTPLDAAAQVAGATSSALSDPSASSNFCALEHSSFELRRRYSALRVTNANSQ